MGAVLGSFSEEVVDDYMLVPDETWPLVDFGENHGSLPKTYRLKDISKDDLGSTGSVSGKVARGLITHACSMRGIDADVPSSEGTCVHVSITEIIEQFHHEGLCAMKVQKDADCIMRCISAGYPVSVAIPVTAEIFEKTIEQPTSDNIFGMMPVVLYGYSSVTKRFAAFVPLSVCDEAVAVSFEHVTCDDACDLYVIEVTDNEEHGDSQEQEALFLQ